MSEGRPAKHVPQSQASADVQGKAGTLVVACKHQSLFYAGGVL